MASPYKVDLGPEQPRLPGSVVLRETFDDLLDSLCADIHLQANGCVREFGDFQLVVSPTDFAERVLTRLMIDPHYRDLPWARTRVWLADDATEAGEGGVSADLKSVADLLVHAGLPAEQLHGFHAAGAPDQPAEDRYEALLRETLGWREKGQDRPDFALLSLDAGGGVAGVAAQDIEISSPDRIAVRSLGERGRVTMTLSMLNACRFVGVIASGEDRAAPVARIAESDRSVPASGLEPLGGELRWYLDHAACPEPETDPREDTK
ncbi:MAG: 6-phosphogluconolactonase/glucosamine-6-phosphate isomerase/deaminase [Phycisphaerales bacterium]|jgi:6-phosphogluconolactonase/glucosamine-6-phosphate isomerase/deaminase